MLTASARPQSDERARELERLYQARRGHAPSISISDDSHHITEAIGDMYGENEFSRRDSRPLSFISSPTSETFDTSPSYPASPNSLDRTSSNERQYTNGSPSSPKMLSPRNGSFDRGAVSPPRLNRQNSDTASQTFEFQDIDSQSSPAALAQELSNLQAIRRMSMDVHGSDPDLPTFGERPPMPAAAPSHDDDEDDPSRMFWVPARVHPELAPKEFKTFIEEKNSGVAHAPTLSQLESVEEDPATLIRRMSLRDSIDSGVAGVETGGEDDVPILPVKPTAIPGHTSATRSDSLAIIPTFADDKKSEKSDKKSRKADKGDDDDDGLETGGRKTSWGWFSRKNKEKEDEEEREKKDKEEKEHKKSKSKLTKSADKSHDNTRLDVLQASIEEGQGRGRESLVLDRNSVKLDEERQKTSSRKTSNEKKEKEGLFSSIFGGKAKKGERESGSKKATSARGLSPDPPPRQLKPDIDYNWTRFSILEERAIYRMAHIKLANPRRELYSQVLLSNFMYSYLAKVQQMHPHIQIGQSAAQKQQQRQAQEQKKKEEEQRRQQQQQQPEEFKQYQMYQDVSHDQGIVPRTSINQVHSNKRELKDMMGELKYDRMNGNQYSVSSGQSYLGHAGEQSQPMYYGQQYEDEDDGRNDMW
ncbi:putative telomere silencing protein zds1 protein [Neofusicoccum parvum UCRNP2]|uniref:Putative telomere silencing protein zds1 protein n=1 Tax=Botryosphaeria parva (strain UCR-NP2) TaxID=1287680 RepID=R1GF86_BOTPV|nr:putative telomere silencing protein zds1 protein [Neofusicoccum parvum UCRNP2]